MHDQRSRDHVDAVVREPGERIVQIVKPELNIPTQASPRPLKHFSAAIKTDDRCTGLNQSFGQHTRTASDIEDFESPTSPSNSSMAGRS